MIQWGVRLHQKFPDERAPGRITPKNAPKFGLDRRDAREVFMDHLAMRRAGRLDLDLARNYSPDVILTSNHGTFFGHDGVQQSAAILARRRCC